MRAKRGWLIFLAVIIIGLIGIGFAHPYQFTDFSVYYAAGHSLLAGRTDLYAPDFALSPVLDYRYPPLFILLFSPFSLLPAAFAQYVWYWVCIFLIGGSVYLVWKMIRVAQPESLKNADGKINKTIWILTLLIVAQYFLEFMKYGNIHVLIMFLLLAAFYLVMRGRNGWAAISMSLAVTIKLIPLIALPYFALKKKWKFLTLTILLTVLLNLAPGVYFGFNRNIELLQNWYRHVVLDHESHEKSSWADLSLKGQLRRYLTDIDYTERTKGTDNTDDDYEQINFVSIPEETSNLIWIAGVFSVLAICLLIVYLANRRGARDLQNFNRNLLVEYSLIICLMLFAGPLTPRIYFIKLLIPAAFLTSIVFSKTAHKDNFNRFIIIMVAAAGVILPLLPGREIQRLLLVVGTNFYINCLMIAVAVNLLLQQIKTKKPPEIARPAI